MFKRLEDGIGMRLKLEFIPKNRAEEDSTLLSWKCKIMEKHFWAGDIIRYHKTA